MPGLGNFNEYRREAMMHCVHDDKWCLRDVPIDTDFFQYKYAVLGENGKLVRIEEGNNRIADLRLFKSSFSRFED